MTDFRIMCPNGHWYDSRLINCPRCSTGIETSWSNDATFLIIAIAAGWLVWSKTQSEFSAFLAGLALFAFTRTKIGGLITSIMLLIGMAILLYYLSPLFLR